MLRNVNNLYIPEHLCFMECAGMHAAHNDGFFEGPSEIVAGFCHRGLGHGLQTVLDGTGLTGSWKRVAGKFDTNEKPCNRGQILAGLHPHWSQWAKFCSVTLEQTGDNSTEVQPSHSVFTPLSERAEFGPMRLHRVHIEFSSMGCVLSWCKVTTASLLLQWFTATKDLANSFLSAAHFCFS